MPEKVLETGELSFSVQARLLRELGERLVRRPEVAIVELIKNSYDAEATQCSVQLSTTEIILDDDGHGMTKDEFITGWMRLGTGAKAARDLSPNFDRAITGEKGIGRFSVRFLGSELSLRTTAWDAKRKATTTLEASFDWPTYDTQEDLGKIRVPYRLLSGTEYEPGTVLTIEGLRHKPASFDLRQVRTASVGLLSPLRSMLPRVGSETSTDPGFRLVLGDDEEVEDVAAEVLKAYEERAVLTVNGSKLVLAVYRRGELKPYLRLADKTAATCGDVYADLRFFPRRSGAFRGLDIDGRRAYSWIRENAGIAVFDRDFRVSPYGEQSDDWLRLDADNARNYRLPRSALASKHFPMSDSEARSTSENWMLRLPQSRQMVGVVRVTGRRNSTLRANDEGLIAAADREGFVANEAFDDLWHLIRGSVEAIAMVDRRTQQEEFDRRRKRQLDELSSEAEQAIRDLDSDPEIPTPQKDRLTAAIRSLADTAQAHEAAAEERVRRLEVMSLLGVVAGYMTHEFGIALHELQEAQKLIAALADRDTSLADSAERIENSRLSLLQFAEYSTAYIRGANQTEQASYTALPRIKRVKRYYGSYAADRKIKVSTDIETDLAAPQVPTALYDGVALNLFTNALKAVTGASRPAGEIAFRAWNDKDTHTLEVCDTGVGIPAILAKRVFDPLFTTTESRNDPLGSGLGLGLSLVRSTVEAFGGRVDLVEAPSGFTTCVRVRLPLSGRT